MSNPDFPKPGARPLSPVDGGCGVRAPGSGTVTTVAAPATGGRSLPAAGRGVDRAIRASTAAVVLAVAGIAAYISYWHAYAVVREYGESGVTALLEPATIDGLVYASSMVILHAARHCVPVPRLARWMLALGIAASLAVNVAQGWSHGLVGAVVAAWPAVSLVGKVADCAIFARFCRVRFGCWEGIRLLVAR
jgi:hypothetical protein